MTDTPGSTPITQPRGMPEIQKIDLPQPLHDAIDKLRELGCSAASARIMGPNTSDLLTSCIFTYHGELDQRKHDSPMTSSELKDMLTTAFTPLLDKNNDLHKQSIIDVREVRVLEHNALAINMLLYLRGSLQGAGEDALLKDQYYSNMSGIEASLGMF